MKSRFQLIIRYFLFWLLFFLFARLFFMIYQFPLTMSIPASDWLGIYIRGIWMDLSLIGYILLVSGVFLSLLFFISAKTLRLVFHLFTIILLSITSLIIVADAELYRNWGFRIDATPILYLKTPGEAMASVKPLLMILLLGVTALYFTIFFFLYKKNVFPTRLRVEKGSWWFMPVFLFFSALMIIPIRGGFGIAPMNTGKVYFSQNVFSNHAALNAAYNMMYSLSKSSAMYKRYPDYIDRDKGEKIFKELTDGGETSINVLKSNKPNIVIILLESFSSKLIEPLGGRAGVTPCFNKLCDEGILFTRMFSSGDRSDKGLIAVISGFPAQSTQSIIKYPLKSQKLPTISGMLNDSGYHTAFYYGGDPDFANIRSYLFSSRFKRIITQDDFPRAYRNSKWGVHDEYTFSKLLSDIDTARMPFFKMLFTLTSHEPFEIPAKPRFPGNTEEDQFINSAFYADSCLGAFFEEAKKRDWYSNTLFILIADHGHRHLGKHPNYAPEKFAIPMLWVGGALEVKPMRINTVCSQVDLSSTLLKQLGYQVNRFTFSKDLFQRDIKGYAYYAFNDGFGFLTDSTTVIFDHISKKHIIQKGSDVTLTKDEANAFFSVYQEYFLGL